MADRSRRPTPPQEQGTASWMNTYGDMVTLLLTFFIMLFAFSTVDTAKWEQIVKSFSGIRVVAVEPLDPSVVQGPGGDVQRTPSPVLTPRPTHAPAEGTGEEFDALFQSIRSHIAAHGLGGSLNVEKSGNVILLRITDSLLFNSGDDSILPAARPVLASVADIFEKYQNAIHMIRIEGHTDNVPISNSRFSGNWELSTSRAVTVLEYFIDETDIPPGKYTAVGYSEYHPVASNDTPEGRARNRRVDFVIEGVDEQQ